MLLWDLSAVLKYIKYRVLKMLFVWKYQWFMHFVYPLITLFEFCKIRVDQELKVNKLSFS